MCCGNKIVSNYASLYDTMRYNGNVLFNAIQCDTMRFNAIQCDTMVMFVMQNLTPQAVVDEFYL